MYIKYPRTFHLPWSAGKTSDDKILSSLNRFVNQEIVVTEKLDGENTTLYNDHYHARSIDSQHNFTRNWIKFFHSNIAQDIPQGWRICGENLSYVHSIEYNHLESFFYMFSIWNDKNVCLDWKATIEWAKLLDLKIPKVFYQGIFDEKVLKTLTKDLNVNEVEGYVIRNVNEFHYDDFSNNVAKYVRKNHVQTDKHWLKNTKPNQLNNT